MPKASRAAQSADRLSSTARITRSPLARGIRIEVAPALRQPPMAGKDRRSPLLARNLPPTEAEATSGSVIEHRFAGNAASKR